MSDDADLLIPAGAVDETHIERLADPHPGLSQQRQQESIPHLVACCQHRHHLLGV